MIHIRLFANLGTTAHGVLLHCYGCAQVVSVVPEAFLTIHTNVDAEPPTRLPVTAGRKKLERGLISPFTSLTVAIPGLIL